MHSLMSAFNPFDLLDIKVLNLIFGQVSQVFIRRPFKDFISSVLITPYFFRLSQLNTIFHIEAFQPFRLISFKCILFFVSIRDP